MLRLLARTSRGSIRRRSSLAALAAILFLVQQHTGAHDGFAERIAVLNALIVKNPDDADLLVERAELYRFARQWKQAHADLDRARVVNPMAPLVDLARAHTFLDAGEHRQAIRAATRFLTAQPGHVDAFIVRARAFAKTGAAKDAVMDFTRALDERPSPELYIERAHVFLASPSRDLPAALRGLDEGIARLGPIVTLELEAIDLELRSKCFDAALSRLARVAAQSTRQENWLRRRGEILEQAGRLDEAGAAYRAGLSAALNLPESARRTRMSAALIQKLQDDLDRIGRARASHDQKR